MTIAVVTVHLNKLEFFAHHGLHDEEAIIGTTFEVSLSLSFQPTHKITLLSHTINYADVYSIIERHMKHPVILLEMLAETILDEVHQSDARIKNISITINKMHAPIANFSGVVGVTFNKDF